MSVSSRTLNRLGHLFIIVVGTIENDGSTTTVFDIAKWHAKWTCALRIAENYCKSTFNTCLEVECS